MKLNKNQNCCENKEQLKIEYLYLGLSICERCQGAEQNLEDAIEESIPILQDKGYVVTFKKIYIESEQCAIKYKSLSSPTIRVNGVDIFEDVKENICESCGTLCGDESVDCRTFVYNGDTYDSPPTPMIAEAILNFINNPKELNKNEEYVMPENLKKYFIGKEETECCTPS